MILSVVLGLMFPLASLAADTANTEINTKIQTQTTENAFFADVQPISDIFQQEQQIEEKNNNINEVQDERLGEVLSVWREKQLQQWETLPQKPFLINASAYTASIDECGSNKGITSSGVKVEANRTIACPPQFPFGAKIGIEGLGTYVCEDRGGAIKGNHIDIYMQTKEEAFAFGRQNLLAQVVM